MFKQPKCCIRMVVLMLLLPTEATNEDKTTLVWTNVTTRIIEDPRLFKKV